MAHKKAQWSTSNGRDSNAKRLGVKLFWGQKAIAGNIILRQKGNKYWGAEWTTTGSDFTIHANTEGTVKFFKKKRKNFAGNTFLDTYVSII